MSEVVQAWPAKRFFVEMFTRDIDLQDSILDLLDNCIDGILRSIRLGAAPNENKDLPYQGYSAEITFNKDKFKIVDNCGGIPHNILKEQAFRMGRPPVEDKINDGLASVGMYGIGMKRSIFKMGRSCTVKSFTKDGAYQVIITPEWMLDDKVWELSMVEIENDHDPGTHIEITNLLPNISILFDEGELIHTDFPKKVGYHFSFIIQKGFIILINNEPITPREFGLLVSGDGTIKTGGIAPFLYQGTIGDVKVSLAVGFYREMLNDDEVDEELQTRRNTDDAGWTIVCNDRVVLYNDKTRMTGWGEAGVPQYHTQFIGILGVVFFTSNNPASLPLTTTKRGVDGSSQLYLYVKNIMRQGLKKFTDFTNQWKKNLPEERKIIGEAKALPLTTIVKGDNNMSLWKNYKGNTPNEKFINLPLAKPLENDPLKQIKFYKKKSEIDKVCKIVFGEDHDDISPSDVGEACFRSILNKGGVS